MADTIASLAFIEVDDTPKYNIEIIIENKKMARDPEGETIARELIERRGFTTVKSVRSGKYLRFTVEAENEGDAIRLVERIVNDLRIFNPVVHTCNIRAEGEVH
ncbi:MAG: phosphoribosylformylglycinamidine synthase subunit PurS [Candidatus Bathyarchaeia archaeon]